MPTLYAKNEKKSIKNQKNVIFYLTLRLKRDIIHSESEVKHMIYPSISLKAARVNAEFTQKEASEKLGISQATLQNYENGITFPTMDMVEKISKLYDFPKDYIFFGHRYA